MSGYDMKAFIAQSIGFFWQESYGQIYPTLKRLQEARMITRKVRANSGRPDRHVYSITAAGKKHLQAWMKAETEPDRLRHELLLKLFFGPVVAPDIHERQIRDLLDHQNFRLEQFEEVKKGILKEYEGTTVHAYWYSTLRFGELVTQARIAWCRETLKRIRTLGKNT
jgi:DNA-binding PadR family transcriptional regulator